MTIVNQLIDKAKAGAQTLPIQGKDVASIARHFRMSAREPVQQETCERMVREGKAYICGVRVVLEENQVYSR